MFLKDWKNRVQFKDPLIAKTTLKALKLIWNHEAQLRMKLLVSNIEKSNRDYGRFSCLMIQRFEGSFPCIFWTSAVKFASATSSAFVWIFYKAHFARHNSGQRTLRPAAYNEKCFNSWQRGLSCLHDEWNSTSKSTKCILIGPPGGIGTEYSQSIFAG